MSLIGGGGGGGGDSEPGDRAGAAGRREEEEEEVRPRHRFELSRRASSESMREEEGGGGAAESCSSRVADSCAPGERSSGRRLRRKVDVYGEVLRRLREVGHEEASRPGFEEDLWAHFNRLPIRYALDVNVETAEDVLLHKELLHMAQNPAARPAIEVRLGQVPSLSSDSCGDSVHSTSPRNVDAHFFCYKRGQSIHPLPDFGLSPKMEVKFDGTDLPTQNWDRSTSALGPSFLRRRPPMAPPRILLCGDVRGRLGHLFKRVSSVNKAAGPFDALLCVGQFFPDAPELLEEFADHVEGRSPVPLPTYFVGDYGIGAPKVLAAASRSHASMGFKMDGLEICENLYWLKGSGKFTLHGLSVAYISGRHSLDGQQFGTYSQDDVDALRALTEEPGVVDVFLSNEWPSGITNRAAKTDVPPGISEASGSDSTIAEIVAEIKPRYHIAGTKGVFYAREPYLNADTVHVTRFIGLASVGNKEKQKFIHALSPTPASTMSSTEISMKPPNTTLSPFTAVEQTAGAKEAKKRTADDTNDAQYWRYDVSQKRQKHAVGDSDKLCFKYLSSGSCPRGEKCNFRHDIDAREQYRRGVCFDFLNKGKCERGPDCNFKHSLQEEEGNGSRNGNRSRGANVNRSKECWFCLSSPNVESHLIISVGERYYCALPKGPLVEDHVLIIPIEHSPNTLSLPPETETELNRFQNCLKMYHKNQRKEVVFFEWVSKRGTHANLQAIPVPLSRAAALQSIFSLAAEKLGFKFNSSTDGREMVRTKFDSKQSLFYVELPEGAVLSHTVDDNETFPAQFGREVVAGLLNVADKADWRNCALSKEEEIKLAEDFKRRFAAFDPST